MRSLQNGFLVAERLQALGDPEFDLAAEDSIIQRFEYTYESFWKFLKKYLELIRNAENVNSPKNVFRACVK